MTLRNPDIGRATILDWSRTLPRGACVLDLGCGHGVPVSEVLVGEGFDVYGLDASPTLITAYSRRFPHAHTECAPVEHSNLFGRQFDAVVSVGLMFLLSPDVQRALIGKVSHALKPRGRFVFTAPDEAVRWQDSLTGAESISLGTRAYRDILREAAVSPTGQTTDEGMNDYHFALK
jgi:cyclopropane fatty-acyl-phospholipid synthase-like methyltransferase